ncbi:MAG: glycosyltransferase family 39 protein [Bacteroidota bacterium]|nr:glycosyltransferase family 39 protein [Bacteroidota bacterium]
MSALNAPTSLHPARNPWNSFIWLTFSIVIIRLVFISVMGIMPQDAYYDFYAQHLDLSYYDHPPIIAYLLRSFTGIFGKKVFALKLADSTVTWLSVLAFYALANRFLSLHRARYALLLLLSTFMVTILSLISTPDVPLVLCWTISLFFLHKAVFESKKIYWIWAGVMSGLCFDSKYTAIFLIIGLVGFLLISAKNRRLLFSRWFLLYLFCFGVTILPVVVWNIRNGFASFKFQSEARVNSMEGFHISLPDFGGVIGHQSAILMPMLLFSLFYFLYRLIRKYKWRFTRIPDDLLFLLSFFVPLFLGFLFISFFYWVKLNWMMPAYITGIIWICRYWNKKWLRIQLIFSLVLHLALAAEVIFYIVPVRSDDTWFGWEDFAGQVKTLRVEHPDAFIFSADDYKTSAVLNFFLDEMVYSKNVVGERALQFDFIGTDLRKLEGRDAIFIDSNPRFTNLDNENIIPSFYYKYFDRIVALKPILVRKNDRVERKFSVFLCNHYHLPGPLSH